VGVTQPERRFGVGQVDIAAVDCRRSTPKEACGVFGVYAPGQPVAHLTYLGLYALQHRGQESAGMAVSDGPDSSPS
jgi:amidophosphoribosyltransferase